MGRLHYAARRGLLSEIRIAIASGESLQDEHEGKTPLHLAAEEGFTKVVRVLLDAGADPTQTGQGGAALHLAARRGHFEVVVALVESGSPVDPENAYRETPAVESARANHPEITAYLLGRGADPQARSRWPDFLTVREWQVIGGLQGQAPIPRSRQGEGWRPAIQKMMAEFPSVEEFAAHHGRSYLFFALDGDDFSDLETDRWVKRLGQIIRSPELLAECEDRFLQGDEHAEALRARQRSARRRERDEKRERRRSELS